MISIHRLIGEKNPDLSRIAERLKPSAFSFTKKTWTPENSDSESLWACLWKSLWKDYEKGKSDCFVLYLSDLTSSSNARSEEEHECCSLDIVSEFPSVFPSELPKTLPPERSVDHRIDLFPDSRTISRSPYRLSAFEEEVRKTVEELLSQGVIRPSTSLGLLLFCSLRRRMENFDFVFITVLWTSRPS